ncbi:MAG TPA: phosphoribosylglycinamide formyltransferase [Gammaproteobacteria bacterium]|nr:phosphoribosylglycinamide formyltransferase [Gammaproteobacteria bacterium]
MSAPGPAATDAAQPAAKRGVVLISGSGSNLQAILDASAEWPVRWEAVISNRPAVHGLTRAARAGVPAEVIDHRAAGSRDAFEAALAQRLAALAPDLIVLAGFMRVLSAPLVERYTGRMLNIHPSLLPAYRGLHTYERALADGQRWHGTTVHFVAPEVDGGPSILQARVPVLADDTPATLQARVQRQEHVIYPQVVEWFVRDRLRWHPRGPLLDGVLLETPLMLDEPAGPAA